MALFFPDTDEEECGPYRAVGFARYREVLEGSFKEFFLVSFLALISLLPFAAGMTYAVLSASALVDVLERLATPEEVADEIFHLAQSPFITGAVVPVNGGLVV